MIWGSTGGLPASTQEAKASPHPGEAFYFVWESVCLGLKYAQKILFLCTFLGITFF